MGFKKAKITTTVVESLKPGETVTVTELPGYLVRRQLGEARIYAVRKHANGKRHFETVGEHGREGWTEVRARRKALDIISALRNGLDPATERLKVKAMPTLAESAETFFDKHGPLRKLKTCADYRSLLRVHIAPCDGAAGRYKIAWGGGEWIKSRANTCKRCISS